MAKYVSSDIVASIKTNREQLLNLINLKILQPELEGRPLLQPFLLTNGAASEGTNDVQRLLQYVWDHQPAGEALLEALRAEDTHPGHQEAYRVIKESMETNTLTNSTTSRDRMAILITMQSQCSARLSNEQMISERIEELQRLFEDLGCTVIPINKNTTDPDSVNMREIFISKTNGLCSKNSVVFVCLLGMDYMFKVISTKEELSVLEHDLTTAVLALPTDYVTVVVEGIHNLEAHSTDVDLWKSLCLRSSRVVVLYTEFSSDVASGKEKLDESLLGIGSLTEILLILLKELNERGALSSWGISYQKLFIMISALWNPLYHTIPCVKGDIDRDVVGTTNHPLPYHLMGTVRSPSNSVYILTAGLPQEFVKGTQVKVCHVFRPDIVCDGEVTDCSENTATVIVTDSHIWTQTLEDIRKTFLDGDDDHGTFVYVYKSCGEYHVNLQELSVASQTEMSSFLESCICDGSIIMTSQRQDGQMVSINIKESSDGEFRVTSTNNTNTFSVSSLQQAKSLFMRLVINEHMRQIRSTANSLGVMPYCHCYILPQRGAIDLLSRDKLSKGLFRLDSSPSHQGCEPQYAVCEFEDDTHYWSPLLGNSMYLSVSFDRNIYLKEVEVRGSLSSPNSIPHGYKVSYSSMLQLPQSRFDTSSLRTEGEEGMAIRLQCIRRLGEDEILTYCTGPFYLIIKPPLHMACQSKKLTLAMKLLFLNEKGGEEVMRSYYSQLYATYASAGFTFNHSISSDGSRIDLPHPDQWLIINYPVVVLHDISLYIPPGVTVTQLLLKNMSDISNDSEFAPPNMIELSLHTPPTPLLINPPPTPPPINPLPFTADLIQCSSCFPNNCPLPVIVPCNRVFFYPVPHPSDNQFHHPICLQVQLRGFNNLTDIEVYDRDILECVVNHSVPHEIFITLFCLEDTGSVKIIHQQKLLPKNQLDTKLIRAFIPTDLNSVDVVNDEYLIVVSSTQQHLTSLQQQMSGRDPRIMEYNSQLLEPINESKDEREWNMVYRYKVKVKARRIN